MAKLVRRVTSNDEIVGSNPARGIYFWIIFSFLSTLHCLAIIIWLTKIFIYLFI